MREVELKGVALDPAATRLALTNAGFRCTFRGSIVDRRYDTETFALQQRDEVVRVRVTTGAPGPMARVEFKGAASYPSGFKVRDEIGSSVDDVAAVERIFHALGLRVTREIERDIEIYEGVGATVRFETYPRMDVLLEVEGEPPAIEWAIARTGIPRASFTAERLSDFVRRFESRTGERAALCAREQQGDFRYRLDDT